MGIKIDTENIRSLKISRDRVINCENYDDCGSSRLLRTVNNYKDFERYVQQGNLRTPRAPNASFSFLKSTRLQDKHSNPDFLCLYEKVLKVKKLGRTIQIVKSIHPVFVECKRKKCPDANNENYANKVYAEYICYGHAQTDQRDELLTLARAGCDVKVAVNLYDKTGAQTVTVYSVA